ncbi:MAG: tetratricopeptide repeat protein, partial [Candidatus Udaeobacter sp.]
GDTAQAKGFAEEARNTLEPLSKDQPDNAFVPAALAVDYAILDEKSSALNEAQRAITLVPSSKDRLSGPAFEENLALVEMIIGENSPAIATLTRLLRTPYGGWLYNPAPITPALLRLDPIWDPLRADPAFQKLCEEKQLITAQLTTDLTPYELYLKGRSLWSKRGGENLRQAIGFYEQAIARDPKYALAYTGLAEAYVLLPAYTATAPQDAYPTAKAAALKALQLDEKLAEAHTALGLFLCIGDLDMAGSISEFQRAIALNPNYATAHHWYGNGPLVALGRFDEAIAEGERAIELDPLSPIINADLGQNLYVARRYDEAIAQLRKTLEIDPTFSYAHYNLGMALQRKGDVPAAIAEYTKAQQLSDDPFIPVLLASAKAQSGDKDAAVQMLAELEELSQHRFVPSYWRTLLYLSLGNRDEAIRRLEQAIADHESLTITMIKGDPKLDPLRGDPRFEALVQKVVGLEHK